MSDIVHGILFGTPKLYIAPYGEAELGLVDKVFAVHAGNRGFDSHRRQSPSDISDLVHQDIRTQ